jgi:hypothetical protein
VRIGVLRVIYLQARLSHLCGILGSVSELRLGPPTESVSEFSPFLLPLIRAQLLQFGVKYVEYFLTLALVK